MARSRLVQVGRLRDQVYRLIREDIKTGELTPGQRILESRLAGRYGVSRTPVREALFQLLRDGLLSSGLGRGYFIAIDTLNNTRHRHEVRDLIDPVIAWHAAKQATSMQKRALAKTYARQKSAQGAGRVDAFVDANVAFHDSLRAMCDNTSLTQCSAVIDDQAQQARRNVFMSKANRRLELEFAGRLVSAIELGDATGAKNCMQAYISAVGP